MDQKNPATSRAGHPCNPLPESVDMAQGDPQVRSQAVRQLGELDNPEALVPLGAAAVSDRSLRVRQEARQAVETLCARTDIYLTTHVLLKIDLLRQFLRGLESDHLETRTWVLSFLHPALVARLVKEDRVPLELLLNWVAGRTGLTKVGWWAALALSELDDRRAIGPLSHSLRIGSDKVRRWLLQVVGEIGYLRLVEFLGRALKDRALAARQRREAARALGALGHPAALPWLREKARFWVWENPAVKAACREAISQIEQRGVAGLPMSASVPDPSTETLPRPVGENSKTRSRDLESGLNG